MGAKLEIYMSMQVDKIASAHDTPTMSAESDLNDAPPSDNIRTLVYYFGLAIDARLSDFRRGTAYENVRPSDVRLFVTAARAEKTISEIARELGITRQAAQMSVQRLLKLGVVELRPVSANKRDKLVVITQKGQLASKSASHQIKSLESALADAIGEQEFIVFRKNLNTLLAAVRSTQKTSAE